MPRIHTNTVEPGAGVAVVLGEVQLQPGTRHLRIEREVVAEAVLPIDREAEEVDVEFFGFSDVEDAQDGYRFDEPDAVVRGLGRFAAIGSIDLGCEYVPVIEAELPGDDVEALAV